MPAKIQLSALNAPAAAADPSSLSADHLKILHKVLADECPVTLEHAQVHLDQAKESQANDDIDQLIHDSTTAGCLLLVFGRTLAANAK